MLTTLQGYRTLVFNAIMAGLLIMRAVYPEAELPDDKAISAVLDLLYNSVEALTVVGNVILRAFTTTPIFKKEESV